MAILAHLAHSESALSISTTSNTTSTTISTDLCRLVSRIQSGVPAIRPYSFMLPGGKEH